MNRAKRILLAGGIALALWGMAHGLWYAVFAEHQALDGMGASLSSAFVGAAQRDGGAANTGLEQYRKTKYVYDRQVDVHSHWIGLAMLLIVLGIGLDQVAFSERMKSLLAIGALLGSILFPLGVMLQTLNHGSGPRVLAVLGSALVILALAAFALGFARTPSA
jgi:hypothetical protein